MRTAIVLLINLLFINIAVAIVVFLNSLMSADIFWRHGGYYLYSSLSHLLYQGDDPHSSSGVNVLKNIIKIYNDVKNIEVDYERTSALSSVHNGQMTSTGKITVTT